MKRNAKPLKTNVGPSTRRLNVDTSHAAKHRGHAGASKARRGDDVDSKVPKKTKPFTLKDLIPGRKRCEETVQKVEAALRKVMKTQKSQRTQVYEHAKTTLQNLWFLRCILTGEILECDKVPRDDYRYCFLHQLASGRRFDDDLREHFKNLDKYSWTCRRMDEFTNQMVAFGLELWSSDPDNVLEFLKFLGTFDRFCRPFETDKVLLDNKKCSLPILSRLFLLCHLPLLAVQYGWLNDFEPISEVREVITDVLMNLIVPLRLFLSSDSTVSQNMEIVGEIFYVFQTTIRCVPDLDKSLLQEYASLFPKCCDTLVNYSTFLPVGALDNVVTLDNVATLRLASHISQLWLFGAKELDLCKGRIPSSTAITRRNVASTGRIQMRTRSQGSQFPEGKKPVRQPIRRKLAGKLAGGAATRQGLEVEKKAMDEEVARQRKAVEEAQRKAEEAQRKAEDARVKADEARVKAEEVQKKAQIEAQKALEETEKKFSEIQKDLDESRKEAEKSRKEADDARKQVLRKAKAKADKEKDQGALVEVLIKKLEVLPEMNSRLLVVEKERDDSKKKAIETQFKDELIAELVKQNPPRHVLQQPNQYQSMGPLYEASTQMILPLLTNAARLLSPPSFHYGGGWS
jgi:hypothetical protein